MAKLSPPDGLQPEIDEGLTVRSAANQAEAQGLSFGGPLRSAAHLNVKRSVGKAVLGKRSTDEP
jgi:hypothetical protein